MKTQSTLGPNWFLTHTPAPGSERPYLPLSAQADTQERPGDLCGLGGEFDTGAQLRAIHGASRREQLKIERSMS
jgi:hypothetical protein